jgi:hypothetical protein
VSVDDETAAVTIDVATLAVGEAAVVVHGAAGPLDQLAAQAAAVEAAEVLLPSTTMVGGTVAGAGRVTGAGGEPLIGRGGFTLLAPGGLAVEPVPLGTPGLFLGPGPDYTVHADAAGDYVLTASPPSTSGELRLAVITAAAVREVRLSASAFQSDAARGDVWAVVVVAATADSGASVAGVPCAWRASRPVGFEPLAMYPEVVFVRSPLATPVDVTCWLDGQARATATIR